MDKKEFIEKLEQVKLRGGSFFYVELSGNGILVVSSCSLSEDGRDVFLCNSEVMGHIPLKMIKGVF